VIIESTERSAMSHTKPTSKDEPAPYTMDDIARKFLSTAPTPRGEPLPKPKRKKAKAPAQK
jgi:hypothetical protein